MFRTNNTDNQTAQDTPTNLKRRQAPAALFPEKISHRCRKGLQSTIKSLDPTPPPLFTLALPARGTALERLEAAQGPFQRQRGERGILLPGFAEAHELGERLGRLGGEVFGIVPCFGFVEPGFALAQALAVERLGYRNEKDRYRGVRSDKSGPYVELFHF